MTQKISANKDLNRLLVEMQHAGYVVFKTRTHIKITNPITGSIAFIPSTPRGGTRTRQNMLRDLKRVGWPNKVKPGDK